MIRMRNSFHQSVLFIACALIWPGLAQSAYSQAIERHLPETPKPKASEILAPNAVPAEQDDTPIGPELKSVVLLGPTQSLDLAPSAGVTIGELRNLSGDGFEDQLSSFLGQKISRRLIAEIEAAVATRYRELNYPFVSLSTPEQEITGGILQIRVVEFRVGAISVTGDKDARTEARLLKTIGLQTGDAINARELTYDLDWANRYPFSNVQAIFSPGQSFGVSDLNLTVRQTRPWQGYLGYSNDGSRSTSFDRFFIGGAVGGVLADRSVLSAQMTASRDVFERKDKAHYKSAALAYTLPFGPRGQIEATTNLVETYQDAQPFGVKLKAAEGGIGYRFGFSKFYGDVASTDLRVGVEAKHQTGITFFGDLAVYEASVEVYQSYIGIHRTIAKPTSGSEIDIKLTMSPGNLNDGNSDAQAKIYSQGRQKDAAYSYLSLSYERQAPLRQGLSWQVNLLAQLSPDVLPRTEQAGLGGAPLVRGYTLESGAFDSAVVLRNEIDTPAVLLFSGVQLSPFIFADVGYGRDNFTRKMTDLASTGIGGRISLNARASLNLTGACALTSDDSVEAGDCMAHARLSVAY